MKIYDRHIRQVCIFQLIALVLLMACQRVEERKHTTAFAKSDSIKPPVIKKAGPFEVLPVQTLQPPEVTPLSEHPSPTQTEAGFYVTMENFNTEDGLALSSLICSIKDNKGNLWFGTSGNGLSVYNGHSFTNYSSGHGLIHNFITSIMQDSKGIFWFGTYGGVSKYDGVTFENFTLRDGLPDNTIREILEDKNGTIWIASAGGVSRYHPSDADSVTNLFINYDAEDGLIGGSVLTILEDRNGRLWFAGAGGISKYNGETPYGKLFIDYSEKMGVKDQIVNTLLEDSEGNIWLGTQEYLVRYDPNRQSYKRFTKGNGLTNSYIISSARDSRDNLWFGTKGGVSKYIAANESFLTFTTEQGLADNQVQSITEDNAGSLWFGTYGGGVSKYDGESLYEFSADQGLPGKAIYAITEDRNENLWFAPLYGGIVEFLRNGKEDMGGTFINYTEEHGLASNTTYNTVEDHNGNLWFGTATGLSKFDGKNFYTYTLEQGLPDNYITAMYLDTKGVLWLGTYNNGVSRFDGETFTNFSTEQGLVHKTVWNFLEDSDGILWIATRGGLSRFDGTYFMNFTTEQGLPDNKLATVKQDSKGNILTAGWGGGVSIIKKKNVDRLSVENAPHITENIFEHFSTAEGLANNVVYNILEDRNGNIIIASSYGFTILKGGISDKPGKIAEIGIENYNEQTGYPIKDISHIYSMFLDSRGFLWAGTGDKLVRFDYSKVYKSGKSPTLSLQDIKINYQRISWHTLDWEKAFSQNKAAPPEMSESFITEERLKFGRLLTASERDSMITKFSDVSFTGISPFTSIPQDLVLPYSKNNISFDFIGIETARPKLVRYRYKLEGNDENWSPVTDKTTASFGNIFEGEYKFMVQALSPQGIWSEPLMYSFEVLPPWYRSRLAYIFYILIFCGGVYSVHRFQKARTIRNEREKIQQHELEQAQKIKKAYQELEVEAALEKVRTASIAMRTTSELQKVVNTVSQQMQKINININGGVFIVVNEEVDPHVPIWGSGGAADYVKKAVVPFLDKPIFKCLRDAIKERKDFLVEEYSREEKNEFFAHLYRHHPWTLVPEEKKRKMLSLPGGYTRSATISNYTSIFIINNTGKKFTDEENEILKRFGRVFEQSYIRFLDLQKAENQAKEVLRQASLDRVRGEIASMRSIEDLQQIIPVIWRELHVLDIPFFRCGILILNEDFKTIRFYLSASDGNLLAVYNLPYRANPFTVNAVKHWRKGMVYKEHWDREDFIKWMQSMTREGQISKEEEYPGAKEIPESLYLHLIPFNQGMLYVGNHETLTPEEIDLSKSLAETFSIAYARYEDFNKLEHAKDKVEMALVELKAVQQQLVQQEKLASLGQLTAGIAHEIKNPLNFVTNFTDVSIEMIDELRDLIEHKKLDLTTNNPGSERNISSTQNNGQRKSMELLEEIEKNLHIINEHGRRADAIIKSMLQQSGGNSVTEPINLNNLIKEFVTFSYNGMRSDHNPIDVEIKLYLDKHIEEIPLRAQDFSRVITNLCNNAFYAMREKQNSLNVISESYKPQLTVSSRLENGQIKITFEDNGPGIPASIVDKILQPFFTTKKGTKGTGLGLYITNDIIKAHGGDLEIESELGEYSRFIVKIPT